MTLRCPDVYNFLSACTLSYMHGALITLRSAKNASPNLRLHLFIADGTPESVEYIRSRQEFNGLSVSIFGPHDLLPSIRTPYLACFAYYNAFEVSNVAKYVALIHVLSSDKNDSRCIYADADTCFFGDVVAVLQQQKRAPILLTPHQFRPSQDNVESEYLLHGWLNSGFSVFEATETKIFEVLEWLFHRISHRGYLAPQFGLSGDQPWLSGLPFLFSDLVYVCNASGLNVAYWNLSERVLEESDGNVECNGEPLVFFHFSGFVGATPGMLSKHSDVRIASGSLLEKLSGRYATALTEVEGLRRELSMLSRIPCSGASLQERICKGSLTHGIGIDAPAVKRGLFSRLGQRIDTMLFRYAR